MRAEGESIRHILIVERDMIVGLSLAVDLMDLGYRVSGPFIGLSDVLRVLEDDPPDEAIVDLDLRDGTGAAVARALMVRNIPLVFFTAGDSGRHAAGEFRDLPWIEKPASTDAVLARLGRPAGICTVAA